MNILKIDVIALNERILCHVNYISIKLFKKKLSASLSLFSHLETSDCEGSGQAEKKTWQFPSAFWRPYRILTHQETSQPLASMYTWPGLTW